jgi:hypothetical protein
MNLKIDLTVIEPNSTPLDSIRSQEEMYDFSDDPEIFCMNIPIPKLERQYTLDKLFGPFSEQFLSRVPAAIPAAIQARKSYLLDCVMRFLKMKFG